jgi:hypothetical protein
MKASTHSIRLKRLTLLLVLGAIVAGTAATVAISSNSRPAVQAGDRIVDDSFRDPPSVATQAAPIEHRSTWSPTRSGDRIVDDYWRDRPSLVAQTGDRIVDDYFRDPQPVAIAQPTGSGFDWGDWSIGLVAGFGLALGMAGALLLVVHRLPRLRKTGAPVVG